MFRIIKTLFLTAVGICIIGLVYIISIECTNACTGCNESCAIRNESNGCACSSGRVTAKCTDTDGSIKAYEIKNGESCEILVTGILFSVSTERGEKISFTKNLSTYIDAKDEAFFYLNVSEVNEHLSVNCISFDDIKSIRVVSVNYIEGR